MEKGSIVLTLENIGMLKKAQVDIGGLSVIAGENDEGKSTVGKALMALIKAENTFVEKTSPKHAKQSFNRLIDLLFDNQMTEKGYLNLEVNRDEFYKVTIVENECISFDRGFSSRFSDCTFVPSPLIWDLYNFFSSVAVLEVENRFYQSNQNEFDFKYPYILWDLYRKISIERPCLIRGSIQEIKEYVQEIMSGFFIKKQGKYVFYKPESDFQVSIMNTATGIKSFGILQMLIQNDYMTENSFTIFDEPENHLHATWQVKFAEILARLVQNHVCIMVNTHSPYMLEALHKYGKKYAINTNFYLADSGKVEQIDNDNSATLEKIYKKLNQSFISLDEILDEEEE
ncbi:MAG: ATP-binding protein [Helicobacter sp.]|nr:ATP-binding protein [Helicobacter sp.]